MITQEMNGLMNSVSLQIQKAKKEAINEQVLPQVRVALRSVNGQQSHRGRNFRGERPQRKSEDTFSKKFKRWFREELPRNLKQEEEKV